MGPALDIPAAVLFSYGAQTSTSHSLFYGSRNWRASSNSRTTRLRCDLCNRGSKSTRLRLTRIVSAILILCRWFLIFLCAGTVTLCVCRNFTCACPAPSFIPSSESCMLAECSAADEMTGLEALMLSCSFGEWYKQRSDHIGQSDGIN